MKDQMKTMCLSLGKALTTVNNFFLDSITNYYAKLINIFVYVFETCKELQIQGEKRMSPVCG